MFGRLQRYVNEVKADITREMELEELRKLKTEVQDAARDIEQSMSSAARDVESGVRSVEAQLNAAEAANAAPDAHKVETSATSASSPPPEGAGAEAPRQAALPGFERQ
jgi:sec-independent protein translocase protein TatB